MREPGIEPGSERWQRPSLTANLLTHVKKRELTEIQFERVQKRNVDFFKYLDGETSEKDFNNTTSMDLGNLQSKALLTGVLLRFNTVPILLNMNYETKGIVMIGIKSLIECFEEIVGE